MNKTFELSIAVFLLLVVVPVSAFCYVIHSDNLASRNAKNFCKSIAVGDNILTLDNRVRSIGQNPMDSKFQLDGNSGSYIVGFSSVQYISTYLCWVNVKEGHVIDRQVIARD